MKSSPYSVLGAGLATVVVLMASAPRSSSATTFPPPVRQFSAFERLENAISASDAIVVGTVTALVDTMMPQDSTVGEGYIEALSVLVHPVQWLRGHALGAGDNISIRLDDQSSLRHVLRSATSDRPRQEVLFFLREAKSTLYIAEDPDFPGRGALFLDASTRSSLMADLARALRHQSLDSLVTLADVGIVGRAVSGPLPRHVQVDAPAVTVAVDTVLFGTPGGATVTVYCLSGYVPREPSVLLLTRDSEGLYCAVGFSAGILPLTGARLDGSRAAGVEIVNAVRRSISRRRHVR